MLKKDWTKIDQRASQAKDEHGETFEKLISFLGEPVKHYIDRDVYMTRGLLYWLKCQSNQKKEHGKDSPLTLAFKMYNGKIGYAEAFTTLCTRANIQCETVKGVAKTGEYKPGDLTIYTNKMYSFWNKVNLYGQWWLIHPRYVLRSFKGHLQPSGLTENESSVTDDPDLQQTQYVSTFNEFWFLSDPALFIHNCYPDNPENQMLPAAKRIRNPRQFMKLPYLTPVFHEFNLKMTSEETCIVDTIDGLAKISFKANRKIAKSMMCDFSLSLDERLGTDASPFDFDSANLVFSSRKKNQFMFEVRCPVEANYLISISGGDIESKSKKVLIRSKIVCKERMPDVRTLPIDAGQIGWGFGPVATKASLSKPKVKEPKLFIQPKSTRGGRKTTIKMRFSVDKEAVKRKEYTAEICADGKPIDRSKDYVKTNIKSGELQVDCSVPSDGEYALVIKAKDRKEPEFNPICNYLLTTLENEEKVCDEYFDSSDGTSDIDEEISQLQNTIQALTAERDRLKQEMLGQ